MKCPHCLTGFHENWESEDFLVRDSETYFYARYDTCPECKKAIVQLGRSPVAVNITHWDFVEPKAIARSPIPTEVDDAQLIADYKEACLVFADSAKASAALSRRCLQHILREKGGAKKKDLASAIDEVIESLPSRLGTDLDAVRHIGNFASHPMKSTNSGEILDVEPGEAEWNLDVVESLIDYYYVLPAQSKKKREALNRKLKEAGKPEMEV